MKKIWMLLMFIFLLFSSISCSATKTDSEINLKRLYRKNIIIAESFYEKALELFREECEEICFFDASKKSSPEYKELKSCFNFKFKSIIYAKTSDGGKFPLAIEFDNDLDRDKAYSMHLNLEYESFYFVEKNALFLEHICSYMIMDSIPIEDKDNVGIYCDEKFSRVVIYVPKPGVNKIIINDKITEIINFSFVDKEFTELIFGLNVKRVGFCSFFYTSNLESVSFNNNLERIESFAFSKSGLKRVRLPEMLNHIGTEAFGDCPNLEYVTIPAGVKYIGSSAFNKGNIYCDLESRPEGWKEDFASGDAKVYWKGQWSYNENGEPYILEVIPQITENA